MSPPMLTDVLAQPHQIGDALWRVEAAGVPESEARGGLVVCGMGASAMGGDLAVAAIGERAVRPVTTVRGHLRDRWIGPDHLVLCCSYSGETPETLASFEEAGAVGATRVALTTGGTLAGVARRQGVPVVGVPSGMDPAAAIVYMTVCALECAARCHAIASLRGELEDAVPCLESLAVEWGPGSSDSSAAKDLARALNATIPVVHGAGLTAAPAARWTAQLWSVARLPAFFHHLGVIGNDAAAGWQRATDLGAFAAVFLDACDLQPHHQASITLTRRLIDALTIPTRLVEGRGASRTARVFSLVLLGDLVSAYIAEVGDDDEN